MESIITGDIINSRKNNSAKWQPVLKKILKNYGAEPQDWEVFRGDSFQLALVPGLALQAAIHIKAAIKQFAGLDVRMGIGIGKPGNRAKKITESTGEAFIHSGECFDALKKQTLALKVGNETIDECLNLMLNLATLTMDNWSTTVAQAIQTAIENADKNQYEIAAILGKSQSSISEALKRGGYDEVKLLEIFYTKQIARL